MAQQFFVRDLAENLVVVSDLFEIDDIYSELAIPENKRYFCSLFIRVEAGDIVELWGCKSRNPHPDSVVEDLGNFVSCHDEGSEYVTASSVYDEQDHDLSYTTPWDVDSWQTESMYDYWKKGAKAPFFFALAE